MKIKQILLVFSMICALSIQAQNKVKYEMGKKYYDILGYSEAIPYFEDYLSKSKGDVDAMILLADCYQSINDYDNAEKWLIKIVESPDNKDKSQWVKLAQVQQNLEKYLEAKDNYSKYLEGNSSDIMALNQANSCANISYYDDSKDYLIENVGFNKNGHDFGAFVSDDKFYFTSTGANHENTEHNKALEDLYLHENFMDINEVDFSQSEYTFSEAKVSNLGLNTQYHEGPIWITKDKKTIYFTRNDYKPGSKGKDLNYDSHRVVNLKIFKADLDGNNISNIIELPFNSSDYSCGHPVFDEKNQVLIFVSDRPGGFGETDLWYAKYNNGNFETPLNFGEIVNTNGKEMFPFIDEKGNLYFSSNGLGGLGGLDIFVSKLNNLIASKPKSLLKPINSSSDDFSFYKFNTGKVGFISSNRPGGSGKDDIYMFTDNRYILDVKVIDALTKLPIPLADLEGYLNSSTIVNNKTDNKGEFSTEVKGTNTYSFIANAPHYFPNFDSIYIEPSKIIDKYELTIALLPQVAKLLVIDAKTKKPVHAAKVDISSICDNSTNSITTDASGTYIINVPKPCTLKMNATANSYFPKSKSFDLTDSDDTLELILVMDRIHGEDLVLKNIYYDFDKSDIREDAEPDLTFLYNFLSSNPSAKVELSSHTDARANDSYNLALSQRRADAAKAWLVKKGIKASRIVAVGYGERKPINNCTNDIKCTEEEHQMNRRTEFRVLNAGEVIQSVEKSDIKIDKCADCVF